MKTIIAGLLLASSASVAASDEWKAEAWRTEMVALARSEPSVIDALWSAPSSFWVAMQDNGSERDGFASYLCLLTIDAGMPDGEMFRVSIVDIAALANDEISRIGEAVCQ